MQFLSTYLSECVTFRMSYGVEYFQNLGRLRENENLGRNHGKRPKTRSRFPECQKPECQKPKCQYPEFQ